MNKIAVFFAQGFEEIEALTVVDLCRRSGIDTTMVSIDDGKQVSGSHGISVAVDCGISELDFTGMDMLVLPGGMPGTKNLEANERLMDEVDSFYKSGKTIAAICAAPSIFGHKGYLEGRSACCYPAFESHLNGATVTKNPVEKDGNVITSRGMGTAIPFALKIVETLVGKQTAEELAEGIVYQA